MIILRDLIKCVYRFFYQARARLFYVNRKAGSYIDPSARLDIIPKPELQRYHFNMGEQAFVEERAVINTWHGDISLGDNSGIGIGSVLIGPINIGSGVSISQHCFITGGNHQFEDVSQGFQEQGYVCDPVIIKNDVWIGANVSILPGRAIGEHSVVGTGSVVTRDIPPMSIAVGNPAKIIRKYSVEKKIWVDVT